MRSAECKFRNVGVVECIERIPDTSSVHIIFASTFAEKLFNQTKCKWEDYLPVDPTVCEDGDDLSPVDEMNVKGPNIMHEVKVLRVKRIGEGDIIDFERLD